jgi:hypothetical protein
MKYPFSAIICTVLLAPAGLAQGQNSLTVQVLQLIDSTKAANGTQFTGRTVNAITTAQGAALPAGTAATLTLAGTSVGGVNTWTLDLVSPVTGTAGSVGGAAAGMASKLNGLNLPSGLGNFGRKSNATTPAPAAANTTLSTGGTRVYVPANTQVRFSLSAAAATPTATPTAAGRVGQPAAPVQPAAVSQIPQAPAPAIAPNALNGAAPVGRNVQPAAAVAPVAPANPVVASAASQQPGSTTVVWANVQYVLQGCQRQAPHIVCQVQLTNLSGGDANLAALRNSYYVDQSGNKVNINEATAANCNLFAGCLALSGLPMSGNFIFLDEDSKATQLVRLQIQSRTGPVQFTNVQVK